MTDVSNKTKQVRALISTNGTKMMSVTFIKKDKTERTILFNPRTIKGQKGDKASDRAKQATATRKANNPNLLNVCDMALLAKGDPAEKCYRSVNCDSVTKMTIGGVDHLIS